MLPLEGLKAVELAIWLAGPACGAILADCGAEVVKVEHLESGGDPARGWTPTHIPAKDQVNYVFEMTNRGKRSIALDLRQEEGREIMYKLIESADIFITNLRLFTLESLKMDYETLSRLNPRLIYGRATGFGPRGPDRNRLGFDSVGFWARSGLMAVHGEPEHPPVRMRGSLGDVTTATFLFAGVILALYARERTGKGHLVDASLLATGTWVAAENLWAPLITGETIPRSSRRSPPNPLVNSYRCSDDRWFYPCVLQTDRYWPDFCRAIEREDLIEDPRFNNHDHRCQNSAALVEILDEVLGARPLGEWGEKFDQNHIAWGPAKSPGEVVNDPQMEAMDYIVEVDHPTHGRLRELAVPFQHNGESFTPRKAAPEFGDSTEAVLLELGWTWDDILSLKDREVAL
ncbi:MAG: CaiB/BaiF CoA transferase family protein [Dehalococcoidia bacterium]